MVSQNVIVEIFWIIVHNISQHFNNIVNDEELNKNEVSFYSKKLFGVEFEFINSELINFKKGKRP
jgi:hypothetical protein